MEDLKKLKVKNWKEMARGQKNWDRLGCEGETPQNVAMPNDDDNHHHHHHHHPRRTKISAL